MLNYFGSKGGSITYECYTNCILDRVSSGKKNWRVGVRAWELGKIAVVNLLPKGHRVLLSLRLSHDLVVRCKHVN